MTGMDCRQNKPLTFAEMSKAYYAKEKLTNPGYILDVCILSDWDVRLTKVRCIRPVDTIILPRFLTDFSEGALSGLDVKRIVVKSNFSSYEKLFSFMTCKSLLQLQVECIQHMQCLEAVRSFQR